jgi:uncharacterized BrkB/YihY/UPF0761 family membrane protein
MIFREAVNGSITAYRGESHNADKPSDIAKPGWLSIFRRVYTSTSDKNLSVLAAGVAFY